MASERSSFTSLRAIHSSTDRISYSVHCGFGLAASALCAIPFATATDAVILESVLSFIGSSPSWPACRHGLSTVYDSHRSPGHQIDAGSLAEIFVVRRATRWLRLYGSPRPS